MNCSANIVASQSWLSQTSAIGNVNTPISVAVFTASATGLYLVSIGAIVSGPGSPSVNVVPYENNVAMGNYANNFTLPPTVQTAVFAVALNSGDVIGIATDVTPGSSGWYYGLYVTIEQLQ